MLISDQDESVLHNTERGERACTHVCPYVLYTVQHHYIPSALQQTEVMSFSGLKEAYYPLDVMKL